MVALVAAQSAVDICGLILVSTAGRPLGDVLKEQLLANPANTPIMGNAMLVLKSLEAGQAVSATKIDPALMPLFRPRVQRFLMSELTLDPIALLAHYAKPVLIVQGLRDIQVRRGDAERLKRANPQAELALVTNANHVLKTVRTDDRNENISTYSNPDLPLADGVVDVISTFLQRASVSPR
ncbi:pimeloyl-ACP methyl ester carboxylesterase [Paraburkholderia caledonica]|uniref:Pimeloyl-ACP methyl ester carboxylesterase n=1 Tax=Paraburkholderia caledonica TaxID=134536 RepID=A0AB73IPR9_9BURK|nr:pimeloyl-ACP methyl ester carboxylesterase [Paraburkholderia caledonica]